jgi:hypothetical protein
MPGKKGTNIVFDIKVNKLEEYSKKMPRIKGINSIFRLKSGVFNVALHLYRL